MRPRPPASRRSNCIGLTPRRPARCRQRCADRGVILLGINTPLGNTEKGDFGLGALAGREAEFRDSLHPVRRLCARRRCFVRACHGGCRRAEHKARAKDVFIENLAFAAKAAPDLTLLLEPINQRDKPGYFYSTIGEAADIIDEVGAPNAEDHVRRLPCRRQRGRRARSGSSGTCPTSAMSRSRRYRAAPSPTRARSPMARSSPRSTGSATPAGSGCEYRPRAGTDEGLAWVKTLGVSL